MIKAVNDKIVGLLMKRSKTKSGLILPESTQEPQSFIKVISVGEDVTAVKKGEIIVAHVRAGMDVVLDKEIVKILKEDEVYGLLTDKETIALLEDIELIVPKKKEESNIIKL